MDHILILALKKTAVMVKSKLSSDKRVSERWAGHLYALLARGIYRRKLVPGERD
jgi:hypothetical protein